MRDTNLISASSLYLEAVLTIQSKQGSFWSWDIQSGNSVLSPKKTQLVLPKASRSGIFYVYLRTVRSRKKNSSGISIIFNAFPPPQNISLFYDIYFLQCSSLSLSLLLNPRFLVRSITLVSLTLLPFSLYNMGTEVKVHDR